MEVLLEKTKSPEVVLDVVRTSTSNASAISTRLSDTRAKWVARYNYRDPNFNMECRKLLDIIRANKSYMPMYPTIKAFITSQIKEQLHYQMLAKRGKLTAIEEIDAFITNLNILPPHVNRLRINDSENAQIKAYNDHRKQERAKSGVRVIAVERSAIERMKDVVLNTSPSKESIYYYIVCLSAMTGMQCIEIIGSKVMRLLGDRHFDDSNTLFTRETLQSSIKLCREVWDSDMDGISSSKLQRELINASIAATGNPLVRLRTLPLIYAELAYVKCATTPKPSRNEWIKGALGRLSDCTAVVYIPEVST